MNCGKGRLAWIIGENQADHKCSRAAARTTGHNSPGCSDLIRCHSFKHLEVRVKKMERNLCCKVSISICSACSYLSTQTSFPCPCIASPVSEKMAVEPFSKVGDAVKCISLRSLPGKLNRGRALHCVLGTM